MLKGTEKQIQKAEQIKKDWIENIQSLQEEHKEKEGYPGYYHAVLESIEKIQHAKSFLGFEGEHGYIMAVGSYFGIYNPNKKRARKNEIAKDYFETYGKKDLERGRI